jgi:hypothetical protein
MWVKTSWKTFKVNKSVAKIYFSDVKSEYRYYITINGKTALKYFTEEGATKIYEAIVTGLEHKLQLLDITELYDKCVGE